MPLPGRSALPYLTLTDIMGKVPGFGETVKFDGSDLPKR